MSVTVEQYTEGRLAVRPSMLDLSVHGFDGVESVGGWSWVVGLEAAGKAPADCG